MVVRQTELKARADPLQNEEDRQLLAVEVREVRDELTSMVDQLSANDFEQLFRDPHRVVEPSER